MLRSGTVGVSRQVGSFPGRPDGRTQRGLRMSVKVRSENRRSLDGETP